AHDRIAKVSVARIVRSSPVQAARSPRGVSPQPAARSSGPPPTACGNCAGPPPEAYARAVFRASVRGQAAARGMVLLACLASLTAGPPLAAGVKLVGAGTFQRPLSAPAPAGDRHRIFVVEKGGTVRVVRDGVTLAAPFLDVSSRILPDPGQGGLLSIAF